ncbi:TPA: hypothetical protein EYP44_00835, partial [Candidatus Bathyarchaeota archaeon]|nr:hypothetical protein [Candidatus Bathyarchaeota archaeon]
MVTLQKLDLERLKAKLEPIQGLRLLILFGSLADGVPRKGSDVDIVVDCDDGALRALYGILPRELGGRELHVLRAGWLKAEALLHIARRGVVLVDRGLLRDAQARVPGDYFELGEEPSRAFRSWLKGDPVDARLVLRIVGQVDEDAETLRGLEGRLDEAL